MHSFTHSLAHRAPPASRTRGRWQPYAALQSASVSSTSSSSASTVSSTFSARVSPANYLNTNNTTPATSATSSPASSEVDPSRTKDSTTREGNKTKYALTLVDQSVKSLCDIWRPQDIPAVYSNLKASDAHQAAFTSQQRLAQPSSLLAHHRLAASQPSIPTAPVLIQTGTADAQPPLVPVRGFVHEVLKRSRTSGGVLQTALCYLEAIRPKLADLIRQEKEGTAIYGETEPTSTITPATEEELAREAELAKAELGPIAAQHTSASDTIRIDDDCELASPFVTNNCPDIQPPSPPKAPTTELPLLPLLPSPLLCPRRSFLAALILASKFTQDKCYSNRAWAKLSGLSPREIGRCERALGDALDWRLWVGKAAAPAVPAASKPITRSQSDPSIFVTPPDSGAPAQTSGLRRSSTLPDVFPQPPPVEKHERCIPPSSDLPLYLQPTPKASDNGITPTGCSPLSDVPSLSYSPSSTESSSSGERTIQMSTFLEDNMVPPGPCEVTTQSWPWLDSECGVGSAAFAMNVDGLPIKGVWTGNGMSLAASSSPVAKINGKLLSGNGLHAFQYLQALHAGSFGGDLGARSTLSGSHGNGAVHLFDSTTTSNAFDVSAMG